MLKPSWARLLESPCCPRSPLPQTYIFIFSGTEALLWGLYPDIWSELWISRAEGPGIMDTVAPKPGTPGLSQQHSEHGAEDASRVAWCHEGPLSGHREL